MNHFKDVFIREVRSVLGRKSYIFLFLVWPLVYGILIGLIYSQGVVTRMPIAVMDNDRSSVSRAMIRSLDAMRSFKVTYRPESVEEMKELFYRDKIACGVVIPHGLERDLKRGESSVVTAFVNGSNLIVGNLSVSEIKTAVATVSAGIRYTYLRKTGSMRDKAMALQSPVRGDLLKLYNPGYNYLNYLTPGIWMMILQQILMLSGALMIAVEKDKGTMYELRQAAGGSTFIAYAGKSAPYILLSWVFLEIYFRAYFPAFGIGLKSAYTPAIILGMLFLAASLAFGFLLSSFFTSRSDALKGALFVSAPAFLLSGYTWPIASMPFFLRPVVMIIPLTVFLSGFRKLCFTGAGVATVLPETAGLLLMTAVYSILGYLFFRRSFHAARPVKGESA